MRPATPLLLAFCCAIALAAGCTSQSRDKLDNTTWTSKKTTIKNVELPAGARVLEFVKDDKQLSVVYHLEDLHNPTAKPRILRGKYEYNSGDYVTLTFDEKLNDRKQHVEKIVVSEDGKEMTMTDSDGTSLTFERTFPHMKKAD